MPTPDTDPVARLAQMGAAVGLAGLTLEIIRNGPLVAHEQRWLGPLRPSAGPWTWITRLGSGPVVGAMTAAAATLAVAEVGHR